MSVKENIIRLRQLTGVTQEQLAEIADVSRGAVSLWEIGENTPRMGAIQLIADHFHIKKSNIIEDGGMDNMAIALSGRLYEIQPDVPVLDEREIELIRLFRNTNEQGREMILGAARASSGVERKPENNQRLG